jgi:DNA primase
MNNYTAYAETVKERVSVRDAVSLYAPNPAPRRNRIPCPIHAGTNFNLSFTDKLYHCFVCGSGGDVIKFVQHTFGLDFRAALAKINADFGLGIPLDRRMTLREQRDADRKQREVAEKREREEEEKRARKKLYWELWDEWIRLDRNRTEYAPQEPGDEFHPLFVEALQKISYQEYLIDTLL